MNDNDQHQDQGVTAVTLRGIEARWITAVRASDWRFAHVAAEEAALAGMPELASALHRETGRIAVERLDHGREHDVDTARLDAIIDEAGRASGPVYDELEATCAKTGISESDAYDRARAVYCRRRGELATDHGVDVAEVIAREDERWNAEVEAVKAGPWPGRDVDQADESVTACLASLGAALARVQLGQTEIMQRLDHLGQVIELQGAIVSTVLRAAQQRDQRSATN